MTKRKHDTLEDIEVSSEAFARQMRAAEEAAKKNAENSELRGLVAEKAREGEVDDQAATREYKLRAPAASDRKLSALVELEAPKEKASAEAIRSLEKKPRPITETAEVLRPLAEGRRDKVTQPALPKPEVFPTPERVPPSTRPPNPGPAAGARAEIVDELPTEPQERRAIAETVEDDLPTAPKERGALQGGDGRDVPGGAKRGGGKKRQSDASPAKIDSDPPPKSGRVEEHTPVGATMLRPSRSGGAGTRVGIAAVVLVGSVAGGLWWAGSASPTEPRTAQPAASTAREPTAPFPASTGAPLASEPPVVSAAVPTHSARVALPPEQTSPVSTGAATEPPRPSVAPPSSGAPSAKPKAPAPKPTASSIDVY